jgi:hypothetical protein
MRRCLWLSAFLVGVSAGCSDPLVGPVQGTYTSTLTFVEPIEPGTCCPTPCACGSTADVGHCTCSRSSCCPASHCDKNGRHH